MVVSNRATQTGMLGYVGLQTIGIVVTLDLVDVYWGCLECSPTHANKLYVAHSIGVSPSKTQ